MRRRPRGSALFPYTTLFRSRGGGRGRGTWRGSAWSRTGRWGRRWGAIHTTDRDGLPNRVLLSALHEHLVLAVLARIGDRKSTRLNSSHMSTSYAVFCLKKKI